MSETQWRTHRLELDDQTLREWDAAVLPAGAAVRGAVEDERRTALMRTHSGLHVLCGVVFRDFGALVTGGNMEPLTARMDFNLEAVPPGFREAGGGACNARIRSDRKIVVRSLPRAEA